MWRPTKNYVIWLLRPVKNRKTLGPNFPKANALKSFIVQPLFFAKRKMNLQRFFLWKLEKIFECETAPEFTGFKGVTHSTLHPSEQFITYTTETGKRIMRYDVVNDRQMSDLVTYPGEMGDGVWVIAVKYLSDGRLLVTRGEEFEILDEDGKVLQAYVLPDYGWSDINICADGDHAIFSNIFTGIMVKVNLPSGDVVGRINTGQAKPKRALAGLAEFPG